MARAVFSLAPRSIVLPVSTSVTMAQAVSKYTCVLPEKASTTL